MTFFCYISSSYAKIFEETNFQPWEFPRSGLKAKDGEKERRKKERRSKVGNNNGQLRIATSPRVAHAYLAGPKLKRKLGDFFYRDSSIHDGLSYISTI